MGLSAEQIGAMSLWQFMAQADGYRKAHSNEPPESSITDDDMRRMAALP